MGARIFLSYRGDSLNDPGKQFQKEFFEFLKQEPEWKEKYGDIYFSPETGTFDNFINDIPQIMSTVEYFVAPLTENYFTDVWDEKSDCANKESVIMHELRCAIKRKCKFICISFPDFNDSAPYEKWFGNNYTMISGAKKVCYDKNKKIEIFREMADFMVRTEFSTNGAYQMLTADNHPNIYLSFKSETEDKYPLHQKLSDVKKITLLNFASSSFISGINISSVYQECDYLTRWFQQKLLNGDIEAYLILTNPYSTAAADAAAYKMNPKNPKIKKEHIIMHNLNTLFSFTKENPRAKLKIYLTDIALPYGLMITEHKNPDNNHMKVDLYAPVTDNDGQRPSFYMLKNEPSTHELYSFFENNAIRIMQQYAYEFNGHPCVDWIENNTKHIIHKGLITHYLLPHTKKAFESCISAEYPIEVDLLELADKNIIVGRDDEDMSEYGCSKKLSDCRISDIKKINRSAKQNEKMTLNDFLNLICGKIPVLLEIKIQHDSFGDREKTYIDNVVKTVQDYLVNYAEIFKKGYGAKYGTNGLGIAIHSSDPNCIKHIKESDCLIPCGIISTDFSEIKDIVGEDFVKVHSEMSFMDINPDFISYDINRLEDNLNIKYICQEKNIPLIGWTVKDDLSQELALDYCDNMIIEGAKTFL